MNWFSIICAQTGNRKWFSGPDGYKWFAKEFDKRPQVIQFFRGLSTYNLLIASWKIRKEKAVFFWPNGVASYRELKTCDNSPPFSHDLCVLVMACDNLRSVWLSSNLHGSEHIFRRLATQRKPPQVGLSTGILTTTCTKMNFCQIAANVCPLASPYGGYPSQVCVAYANWHFRTCVDLRLRLAGAYRYASREDVLEREWARKCLWYSSRA